MDVDDIIRHATQTFSRVQTQTYYLTHIRMMDLLSVFERIAEDLPEHPDCEKIRQDKLARITIDGYMDEIRNILSADADADDAPIIAYLALNFTWKKQYRYLSVGEMRLWVAYTDKEVLQQDPRSLSVFRCVSARDKMRMDEILPEKDLRVFRRFSVAHLILGSKLQDIFDLTLTLFKGGNPADIDKLALLLDTKQNDAILYFNGTFSTNAKDQSVLIKLHASDENHSNHYAINIPAGKDQADIIRKFNQKLFIATEPINKLRSYAVRKRLPFLERVYYVPEQVHLFFYDALRLARWDDLGGVIVEAQKQWEDFPPYSGVFPIYFALCVEGHMFHLAVYSPHKNIKVQACILMHDDELEARTREFFPDAKYAKDVRRHALDPSRQLKPEDAFLEPYVRGHRYDIISQNVRVPTNKNLPKHLVGQIEKWRAHYRQKLRQHLSKHPQDAERLGLHKSYAQEVAGMVREAHLQKAIRQFVHTKPARQVPADHPFHKQIQQERRRVRQQAAKYTDAEELIDEMLEELNLIGPISGKPIQDPVRSPYVPSGIYQKQSLSQWLGRGGLRLDPLTRKEMPTTFVPHTDEPLKKFLDVELYPKIKKIMQSKQADDVKRVRLIRLRQQLTRDGVFQKVIKLQKK